MIIIITIIINYFYWQPSECEEINFYYFRSLFPNLFSIVNRLLIFWIFSVFRTLPISNNEKNKNYQNIFLKWLYLYIHIGNWIFFAALQPFKIKFSDKKIVIQILIWCQREWTFPCQNRVDNIVIKVMIFISCEYIWQILHYVMVDLFLKNPCLYSLNVILLCLVVFK